MCGKYSLPEFANFLIIVLRAEIATTFGSKMVTISARDTIIRKFANFAKAIFSVFYNITPPNFGILLLFEKGSFQEFFFRLDLPISKISLSCKLPIFCLDSQWSICAPKRVIGCQFKFQIGQKHLKQFLILEG